MSRPRRLQHATAGLAALAVLVGLLLGVPYGLVRAAGWPLPDHWPTLDQLAAALRAPYIDDRTLLAILAVACWALWAWLAAAVLVEAVSAARGAPAPRLPLAGPAQTLAARLVSAVALLGVLATPRPAILVPTALAAAPAAAAETAAAAGVAPAEPSTPEDPEVPPRQATPLYTVNERDDLWGIAERHLADPYRWTEIWDLNRHRPQADGETFTSPDLIHPGWTLELPPDATGLAPPPPPAPSADPAQQRDDRPADPTIAVPHPGPALPQRPAPAPTIVQPAPTRDAQQAPATGPATPEPSLPTAPEPSRSAEDGEQPEGRPAEPAVRLPGGSLVGIPLAAGVAAALALARLHRRRRYQPHDPLPGLRHADPLAPEAVQHLQHAATASQHPDHPDQHAANAWLAPTRPGLVAAGHGPGGPVTIDLAAGLGLTGDGAPDVARALLTALLTQPSGDGQALLADPGLTADLVPGPHPRGVTAHPTLDAALHALDAELLHRYRLLLTVDAADIHDLRHHHPEEPAPPLLLITAPPAAEQRARLAATAAMGQRLGAGVLIVGGDHPAAATIQVDHDGQVIGLQPEQVPALAGARLDTLTRTDAAQLLVPITAAHPDPSDHDPIDVNALAGDASPAAPPTRLHPAPSAPAAPSRADPDQPPPPVQVTLLGPMHLTADGAEIRTGLRGKARELLAYAVLHPSGFTADAAAEALWPGTDPKRGAERFSTVIGNLRSTLRTAASHPDAEVITRAGPVYQADPAFIDADVWRFQQALDHGRAGAPDPDRIDALDTAVRLYTGDLHPFDDTTWSDPAREDLRRHALDAAAKLADLHQAAGDPERAADALVHATRIDPYAEALHRRLMDLYRQLGRPDAARLLYKALAARLDDDLDTDPQPETTTTAPRPTTRPRGKPHRR